MIRRIGVALPIPEPWAAELTSWRAKVGDPQAGSVPAHVTLLPPTDLPQDEAVSAEAHLDKVAVAHAPFALHLRGTGTFRPVSDVVFVAVASGIGECEALEAAVRSGPMYREAQFPYHPHVTVAQSLPHEALDQAYDGLADFDAFFVVGGFTLFEHGTDGVWRPQRTFSFRD